MTQWLGIALIGGVIGVKLWQKRAVYRDLIHSNLVLCKKHDNTDAGEDNGTNDNLVRDKPKQPEQDSQNAGDEARNRK